jgi:hypothetical protein
MRVDAPAAEAWVARSGLPFDQQQRLLEQIRQQNP